MIHGYDKDSAPLLPTLHESLHYPLSVREGKGAQETWAEPCMNPHRGYKGALV